MKSIKEVNFSGKKVLLRVDFNVPVDENNRITDDTRMCESLPTLRKLIDDGAAVIIMAHFGRPKKGGFEPEFSLKPVAEHLSELLGKKVLFTQELLGNNVTELVGSMKNGDVLLLENIRFYPGETKGDEALAKELASLGDAYINDAFGAAHREHASTATVAKFFPNDKYFGFLMENEVSGLEKLMNQHEKPFTAIIGGSKVSSKIEVLENLIPIADNLIIGGGMMYTFFKALGGNIGNSLCEDDKLELAKKLLDKTEEYNTKLFLPIDSKIADKFANDADTKVTPSNDIPDGWLGLDIGDKSIESLSKVISESKTILWNGPMGVFEMSNFSKGTFAIGEAVAKATANGAFSAVGGGDTISAVKQGGIADKISYISTGGGAMLEYLEGKVLPGIKAIKE